MNHVRQQALGNIIIALCAGSRVFLNAKNPINLAMKRIEVDVEHLESLPAQFAHGAVSTADPRELDIIRGRLDERYGRPSILHRTRALLEEFR